MMASSAAGTTSTTRYPTLLLIDADEERVQRLARILTLANYHPFVASTPVQAFKRFLEESLDPQAILLGLIYDQGSFFLSRLLQRMNSERRWQVPLISLPRHISNEPPLFADSSSPHFHIVSRSSIQVLQMVWNVLPAPRMNLKMAEKSLILDLLPDYGLTPRVSQQKCSRNSHFRQVLKAAYDLMSAEQWDTLMCDAGLANYRQMAFWPPDDDARNIPTEYLSCLNQAVAWSQPYDPISQLSRWGNLSTLAALKKCLPSVFMQQVLKVVNADRVMNSTLKAYSNAMNEIRGEELHFWRQLEDGRYWMINYSNLYAYARVCSPRPVCHVWIASIEAALRLVGLADKWEVVEQECSCQTQTGHCLFVLQPRTANR